jgi:putative hydrolase|tara:strand:- start:209 stop:1486 length:1278 start_codon:yes stop_codon:yes gene_type:complete
LEEQPNREELERLIRKMMESGQLDPQDLAKIAGFSADPSMLSDLFGQVSGMTGEPGEPVNWKLALNQALELSKKTEKPANSVLEAELETAFDMARLWLSEATEFTNPNSPKKLTRSMWAQEAMPLFRELSEPVANSMAAALNENLGNTLPPELSEMLAPAQNFIGNAGASIFAMQLGQAIGKLSSEVLLSGEIGIPLTVRPGIIAQNLGEFLQDLEIPKSEVLIYLATREMAIASLYNQASWLREQIITQVREFAAGLSVDLSGIEEIASRIDPTDPGSMEQIIEASAMVSPRSPEQEQALERIETVLALIEGWVDATSLEATKRLPNIQAVVEIFNRKRATSGASAKTFEALLGLEMRPRLRREATLMWQRVVADIGKNASDDLWSHPDQMPTALEIENPDSLIARIRNNGDDFEDELRKFLTD